MLVKDIILKACDFTENDELSSALKIGQPISEEQEEIKNKLVKCFNFVRNEIASEYIPIVKMELVKCTNGQFDLSELSSKMVDIVSVKDKFGNCVKYKICNEKLHTNEEELFIFYNSLPSELEFNDEFESSIPERVYAYGVVKEYYFIQTLYEDAKIWDERFKNSLQVLERRKSDTVLPRRRWI